MRSKKLSAAKPQEPLDGYVFLVEESLGKGLAKTLAENGFCVMYQVPWSPGMVLQAGEIPAGLKDPEVFRIAGEMGYVLLSKDLVYRYHPLERAEIVRNQLAVFQLANGNLTGPAMARAFIAAKHLIDRQLKRKPRPFVTRINQDGKETVSYPRERLIKGLKESELP